MTQEELDALPDVTERFGYREEIIDGQKVRIPFLENPSCVLQVKDDDPMWVEDARGRWMIGYRDGEKVKRLVR